MIHHMVLLKVRGDVSAPDVRAVFEAIGGTSASIPGITGFSWGPYASPEGMNRGYTHGFHMTFTDAAARDAYLPHPVHEQVKVQVLEILEGGVDGVCAFDFES